MPTSGTINSTMIAAEVVAAAMREIGVLASGSTPTGEEAADAIQVLNWMLKSWAADGCNLWREEDGSATFPANTATITLDPFCLDVMEARFVQSSTFERQLQRWETGQYQQLPNKAQRGFPSVYKLTKARDTISMTLWPVPAQEATVLYTYARVPEDVTDGGQRIDVPQQWNETVYLGLAARLAQMFGVTRTDPATAQIVTSRAASLEQKLLDQDRPASVFVGAYAGERYF